MTCDLCASENVGRLVTPAKKLEDTIRLAELVIEVLQQNEEHHAEVSTAHIHKSKVSYYQSRELRTTENHGAFILSLTLFNRLESQSVQYLHLFFFYLHISLVHARQTALACTVRGQGVGLKVKKVASLLTPLFHVHQALFGITTMSNAQFGHSVSCTSLLEGNTQQGFN